MAFLEEWTEDCLTIKSIFEKAKKEKRMVGIEDLQNYNIDKIKVINAREDYAIIELPDAPISFIHPYGSRMIYDIYSEESTNYNKAEAE